MKNILLSISLLFFATYSHANKEVVNSEAENTALYSMYLDPGHWRHVKDRSKLPELYFGFQPSIFIKYNFSWSSSVTEKTYMILGMDFDSDLFAKFGVVLNPGNKNKNRSLSNPDLGWVKLWRYVMVRQALELGYKGHFLDAEENELLNVNYGGFTINYSLIFDGNFLLDKTTWYLFDHRTARRIRLKVDAGLFLNTNKFNQPNLGFWSSSNASTGVELNEDVVDDFGQIDDPNLSNYNPNLGQPLKMPTYPVISPFINFSLGFAF